MSDVVNSNNGGGPTSVGDAAAIETAAAGAQQAAPQASQAEQVALAQLEAKPNPTKAEIKQLNSLRLKVDGREYDEKLPFGIPDTPEARDWMTKQLQMSGVAQKRMSEYSKLETEARDFIEQLREDPRAILSDPNMGIDLKKLAASVIEDEIANSQKSPDQIEKEKLQAELKKIKADREKEKTELQKREYDALVKQETEKIDNEMSRVLGKGDLPKSSYVIKKMTDYLYTAAQNGVDLTVDDILPLVKDEIYGDLQAMFQVMSEDVIQKMVGKDVFNKVRKQNIAKAKGAQAKPPTPLSSAVKDAGKTNPKPEVAKPRQSVKGFFGI